MRDSRRFVAGLLLCAALGTTAALSARPRDLALREVRLDLPGAPSAVVPADLNGDGLHDLLIVIAYTEWGEIGDDRIENMVQFVEVVPALFDRREVRAFLGDGAGGYRALPEPMPLPTSVVSLERGPKPFPVLALTDEGVSAFRVTETSGAPALVLEPVLSDPPVLAGAATLLPTLRLLNDLDGDGDEDLLLPSREGPAIWMWNESGFGEAPIERLKLPGDRSSLGSAPSRTYPLAEPSDLDGDRLPDLVTSVGEGSRVHVLRGTGGGRFEPPREISMRCLEPPADGVERKGKEGGKRKKEKKGNTRSEAEGGGTAPSARERGDLLFLGGLDGAGAGEVVIRYEHDTDDGLDEVREPRSSLAFHRLRPDLTVEREPYSRLEIVGHPFGGNWPELSSSGFEDLDGDGRKDLVTITLDFSVLQVIKVLATKSVSVGVDFHVWSQGADGAFRKVEGLDLSEKLRFDLNDLKLERFAQFQGDFDGDGRIDFVHLGRGSKVTIHRGQPGCRYAAAPDLTVDIGEEPANIGLVRIADLDGDGRADLAVTRPLPPEEQGLTAPARLDLFLSGAAR